MADEKNEDVLTVEGKRKLEERLKQLIDVERPKNIEDLKLARSQGDLSENADYDAAKNRQAEIEGEIKDIEYKLQNYKVFTKDKNDKNIQLDSLVTFKNLSSGVVSTVQLVGPTETDLSDPDLFKIASDSPLGVALIGKSLFEKDKNGKNTSTHTTVEVEAPKPYRIEIVKVQ